MPDAGGSQGNNGSALSSTMTQLNSNLDTIIKPDDSIIRAAMPTNIKITLQEALLMGQNSSNPLGISLDNPVTNPWEALANNNIFQEVHTAYQNFEEQAQRYMGSPTRLSKQEIEFGVYWQKGPYGAYYKYKNGVMMLESHQKFVVLQSRFAQAAEKFEKYLESMEVTGTPIDGQLYERLASGQQSSSANAGEAITVSDSLSWDADVRLQGGPLIASAGELSRQGDRFVVPKLT